MAAVIGEDYLSRPFTIGPQAGREVVYHVVGTDDEEEVEALLVATAPASYLGLAIDSIQAEPEGNGVWKGYARYVRVVDEAEYSFDTSGGTRHVTQSLSTVNAYAPSGLTAPDFQGAIGVSEDKVEGVDVPAPVFNFAMTKLFTDAAVDTAYRMDIFSLTGRVNDAAFQGLAAGECLFLGASGSKRGDSLWSLTFRFSGSPNATGLVIGDITGIAKKGWEYLWVRYADYEDTVGLALVKRPVAVYVEKVSLDGDFSLLGL